MADDSVVVHHHDDKSKIVTKFLLDTYRLLQPSEHHVWAVAICSLRAAQRQSRVGYEYHHIPLITGSLAEFCIQPMLSCVGDIDIMFHPSDMLAIPDGYLPPTELPAEFHSRVKVYEIIDSEYIGYVFLALSYILTEDSDAGKYSAIHVGYDKQCYALRRIVLDNTREEEHGPAVTTIIGKTKTEFAFDKVPCVRCLWWPSQAVDWPARQRNYGWPDSATVDLVVSNGCDFVPVAHHQCKQDEWVSKHQFRLSFSRAEIVLLNSWLPVQQIIYHMLRVFAKTELTTNITDKY